ncbi:hypothetical protein [Paenibacillus gallinarum]|uniref:DnaD domain-containing protein n=1 Tax=Paenibacillus gallinarum TaxID=2762232 RepID=A0ABR8SW85_9BACL|nr:hypothetical protein [Paenibacillus gallinarum]MBD7967722.1 hypothetical protein [Paenibacillus gallinarum]
MAGKGWIKLHRKIKESSIFNDHKLFRLWIICLTEATHKERDQIVGKRTVHLMPGEFVTGRFDITELYNQGLKPKEKVQGEKTVFRWLETLESGGFLTIKKTNKYSIVSIDNWGVYQCDDQQSDHENDQQMTNKRPSNDQQMTTNKNVKNDENEKNDKEEEKDPSSPKSLRTYSEDDINYRLAKRFHELAYQNAVEAGTSHLIKTPNLQKWANTFRLMFERDKVKDDEIGEVVKFALSDTFYRTIIFSPDNLRKHYKAILTRMNTGGGGRGEFRKGTQRNTPKDRKNASRNEELFLGSPGNAEVAATAELINSFE